MPTDFRLEALPDTDQVRVHTDAPGERATSTIATRDELIAAVEALGYTVTPVEPAA